MQTFHMNPAAAEDVPQVFALIAERVDWMNRVGIHQWNDTDYLNVYPLSYYMGHLKQLYILRNDAGKLAAAAVLLEQDERWTDSGNGDAPAFYIHNFASAPDCPGAGTALIKEAEQLALRMGKQFLRLDSADDNPALTAYYDRLGFVPCGTCTDGAYHGILRQKLLIPG